VQATAVTYLPPGTNADYPAGAVVSGSRDKSVRVWDPATAECVAELTGHEYQVTAVAGLPGGAAGSGLVSASLDKCVGSSQLRASSRPATRQLERALCVWSVGWVCTGVRAGTDGRAAPGCVM
jgi:WD40 repeat protein